MPEEKLSHLCVTRATHERVRIGPNIWIEITRIDRGKATLRISAPRNVEILREELIPHGGGFGNSEPPSGAQA